MLGLTKKTDPEKSLTDLAMNPNGTISTDVVHGLTEYLRRRYLDPGTLASVRANDTGLSAQNFKHQIEPGKSKLTIDIGGGGPTASIFTNIDGKILKRVLFDCGHDGVFNFGNLAEEEYPQDAYERYVSNLYKMIEQKLNAAGTDFSTVEDIVVGWSNAMTSKPVQASNPIQGNENFCDKTDGSKDESFLKALFETRPLNPPFLKGAKSIGLDKIRGFVMINDTGALAGFTAQPKEGTVWVSNNVPEVPKENIVNRGDAIPATIFLIISTGANTGAYRNNRIIVHESGKIPLPDEIKVNDVAINREHIFGESIDQKELTCERACAGVGMPDAFKIAFLQKYALETDVAERFKDLKPEDLSEFIKAKAAIEAFQKGGSQQEPKIENRYLRGLDNLQIIDFGALAETVQARAAQMGAALTVAAAHSQLLEGDAKVIIDSGALRYSDIYRESYYRTIDELLKKMEITHTLYIQLVVPDEDGTSAPSKGMIAIGAS